MKRIIFFIVLMMGNLAMAGSFDWGKTGHRATGEIAEQYLSKKAKKAIDDLLEGDGLALVSTFGDDIKSDDSYQKYGPWHYVNLDPDQKEYTSEVADPAGDIVFGIRKCLKVLEDKKTSKEEKVFHLKLLVHFVGDLHQPFHVGHGKDKGGNEIQVRWFNKGTNIHRVWDSQMIDDYQMSYTELAANTEVLSREELKAMQKGSLMDWVYESRDLAEKVYAEVEVGDKLGYDYAYKWVPVVRKQLHLGGIRLAVLLNRVFG